MVEDDGKPDEEKLEFDSLVATGVAAIAGQFPKVNRAMCSGRCQRNLMPVGQLLSRYFPHRVDSQFGRVIIRDCLPQNLREV